MQPNRHERIATTIAVYAFVAFVCGLALIILVAVAKWAL